MIISNDDDEKRLVKSVFIGDKQNRTSQLYRVEEILPVNGIYSSNDYDKKVTAIKLRREIAKGEKVCFCGNCLQEVYPIAGSDSNVSHFRHKERNDDCEWSSKEAAKSKYKKKPEGQKHLELKKSAF